MRRLEPAFGGVDRRAVPDELVLAVVGDATVRRVLRSRIQVGQGGVVVAVGALAFGLEGRETSVFGRDDRVHHQTSTLLELVGVLQDPLGSGLAKVGDQSLGVPTVSFGVPEHGRGRPGRGSGTGCRSAATATTGRARTRVSHRSGRLGLRTREMLSICELPPGEVGFGCLPRLLRIAARASHQQGLRHLARGLVVGGVVVVGDSRRGDLEQLPPQDQHGVVRVQRPGMRLEALEQVELAVVGLLVGVAVGQASVVGGDLTVRVCGTGESHRQERQDGTQDRDAHSNPRAQCGEEEILGQG